MVFLLFFGVSGGVEACYCGWHYGMNASSTVEAAADTVTLRSMQNLFLSAVILMCKASLGPLNGTIKIQYIIITIINIFIIIIYAYSLFQ